MVSIDQESQGGAVVFPSPADDRPLAIEVERLSKTFRIPTRRVDTLKQRLTSSRSGADYRELKVLDEISFGVHRGEFMGVVGRNGSGKSTLLKIMASIYAADGGRVRTAGTVAPFIELGVGFDPNLPARENIVLNGVMMGLSRREAIRRVDQVLDFAELREFADLELKNYSSGMSVRLGFSVMLESDSEILLIDEVLAVGDAAFAKKCADAFYDMKSTGRTVVLVTHDMSAVQEFCDRALLINDGRIRAIGDPEKVARRYHWLAFHHDDGGSGAGDDEMPAFVPDQHARIVEASVLGAEDHPVSQLAGDEPIRIRAVIEALEELEDPTFGIRVNNPDAVAVCGFNLKLPDGGSDGPLRVPAGSRVRIEGTIENLLPFAHYFVTCWVLSDRGAGAISSQILNLTDFTVNDDDLPLGAVKVPGEFELTLEDR